MNTPTPELTENLDTPALLNRKRSPLRRALSRIRSEYGYLLFAALIPAVIVYLLYLVRGIYPFSDGSVLVLDLNGQYVSFYEGLYNILHGDADLFYSFCRNLGGEFMGIYDYYVASPFALLLGLLPQRWMLGGLLMLFMLKSALCGLFMGIYLHKHSEGECNRLLVTAFSIMYALCSYCIVQQHNSMWIDAVLWLPLLTLGIEELIKRGKFRLYVFTLAITIWSNFYIGYMVVIYTVAYCFYYYFAHNRCNENNPLGEKGHFLKSVGRVAVWSVLAVGMAALVILTARYSLSFGKDEFSTPNWEITQKFGFFEFFQKFLPSSYDTVRPSGRPIVYCGVLTIMLVPAFFMSKKFSMREKVAAAFFILFFIGSFMTSTIDLIWHGFQKPNWLNYRYSFMLCFFLLVLAYRAFDQIRYTSRKALLGVIAIIGLYVMLLPELADYLILKNGSEDVTTSFVRPFAMIWLTMGCLFVYFILISLYGKVRERQKETISVILVFVVCVEVFLSGVCDMEELNTDVSYSKYSRYNNMIDTFRPISETLREYDKGFYRTEKSYERKTNDNFALLFKGLSLSTSTLNRNTIDFLKDMGYDSKSHNSHYKGGTPINDSLLGIKYLISDKTMDHFYGEPIFTQEDYGYNEDFKPLGNYKVYQNPYALSLIYGVADEWVNFNADHYASPFDRLNAMVTTMLGEDETVKIFIPALDLEEITETDEAGNEVVVEQPILSNVKKDGTPENHQKYSVVDTSKGTASLTYHYLVPKDTDLYFYLPTRYARTVKIYADNKSLGQFENCILPIGQSSDGKVKLEIHIDNSSNNLYVEQLPDFSFLYSIDWEVFEDAMARLATTQVTIDEGCKDSHLFGSVTTAKADQLMFTSIPYDEGWHVYVDGAQVETVKTADALIAFSISEAGAHELELRYMPKAISLGLSITIVSLIIFVLLLVLYPFAKRIPILNGLMEIQGEDLPALMTPEMMAEIEPGDIGHAPDTAGTGNGTMENAEPGKDMEGNTSVEEALLEGETAEAKPTSDEHTGASVKKPIRKPVRITSSHPAKKRPHKHKK